MLLSSLQRWRVGTRLQRRIARWLSLLPVPDLPFRVRNVRPNESAYDVVMRRGRGGIELIPPDRDGHFLIYGYVYYMAPCVVLMGISPPEVDHLVIHPHDGYEPSSALFRSCANRSDIVLLPDQYFIGRQGFAAERQLAVDHELPWADRRRNIVWRGTSNGLGLYPSAAADIHNPHVIQRARLCLQVQHMPGVDARITAVGQPYASDAIFKSLGIWGQPRPEAEWLGDRYAIDIDGWTCTWSNLLIRMHFGCCVLKVESPFGYRQWYYDRLVAWEHFVPVRADMSDLREKIDWAWSHDAECRRIAENGRRLALSMTFPGELEFARQAIADNWRRQPRSAS